MLTASGLFFFSCAAKEAAPTPMAPAPVSVAQTATTTTSNAAASMSAADGTRKMVCPPVKLLSSGIVSQKPKTAEDLVRLAVKPPVASVSGEWSINSLAPKNENLYLGCYYSSKKILTYKLPLLKEFCVAKENTKNLFVECIKK